MTVTRARSRPAPVRWGDLEDKRICVVGFGREGSATVNLLQRSFTAPDVTVMDSAVVDAGDVEALSGDDYLRDLERFDVILRSPGVRFTEELDRVRDRVTTPTGVFLTEAKARGATVVGVTGTKGKSTTSSLLHAQLAEAGLRSRLAGNIGTPAIGQLGSAIGSDDVFVLELSSYQLEDLQAAPQIGLVTSFFREHVDWHGSVDAYRRAKSRLFALQEDDALAYFNAESDGAAAIAASGSGQLLPCGIGDAPAARLQIPGRHNTLNAALAFRAAIDLGAAEAACIEALEAFRPLEHRLSRIATRREVVWIDDSLSTIPEATIEALGALTPQLGTLIVGGHDRGFYDYDALADAILRSSVSHVVALPDTVTEAGVAKLKQALPNVYIRRYP